jgi:2'-5' RNA ligase
MPADIDASIIILPVESLSILLQPFRRRHTADGADGLPPHVTILSPFCSSLDALNRRLPRVEALCRSIKAFKARIKSLGYFGDKAVTYYKPLPEQSFLEIIHRFAQEFPETPPYQGSIPLANLQPHITVSTTPGHPSLPELEAVMGPRLPFSFEINVISLYTKSLGKWELYKNFPLQEGARDNYE